MCSPAEVTNSLPFSSPYPAIPGPLLIQIKMEIIYYIWYDLPDTVNIPVENQRLISASIKPSLGVSGKENLEGGGGGGRREDRAEELAVSPSLFSLSYFLQKRLILRLMFNEFNNHKLVIKMMQSVKFGTQTPGEKKMHSQKSSSCQGYRMKRCLECEIYL